MARRKQVTTDAPPRLGGNLDVMKADIQRYIDDIIQAETERSVCNETISAARANIKSLGINTKGFAWALAYFKLDDDQRDNIDLSFAICREAVGLPVQADLFDTLPAKED